jgi:hypothetical protein
MTTPREQVPFGSVVESIELISFDGSQKVNLMAQFIELSIFQSINEPLMKATLILYDAIGLFVNFPLVGEEYVIVTLKPTQKITKTGESFKFETDDKLIRHAFVIDSIQNITPADDARSVNFIINLISRPAFENVRFNVSQAYNGRISQVAKSLFEDYVHRPAQLNTDTGSREAYLPDQYTFENIEETAGDDTRTIIIPNMKAITALSWLADRAVSSDFKKNYYYRFYQNFDGFHFTTLQETIRDKAKRAKVEEEKYKYYSDASLIDQDDLYQQFKAITNITINDRFSTLNKIVDGYFENQFFEINLLQNTYRQSNNTIDDYITTMESERKFVVPINEGVDFNQQLNTDKYEKAVLASNPPIVYTGIDPTSETFNRVHYAFNNYMEGDKSQPILKMEAVWGNKERSVAAFSQIDFHVIVPGNTRVQAGDMIYIEFPEMHGFNEINEDPFINGFFIVTDARQLYTVGGIHSTHLRINKDSYATDINTEPYKYGVLD